MQVPKAQRRLHRDLPQAVFRVGQCSKEVSILRKRKHWQNGFLAKCHPPISGGHCQSQTPLPMEVGLCEFEPYPHAGLELPADLKGSAG